MGAIGKVYSPAPEVSRRFLSKLSVMTDRAPMMGTSVKGEREDIILRSDILDSGRSLVKREGHQATSSPITEFEESYIGSGVNHPLGEEGSLETEELGNAMKVAMVIVTVDNLVMGEDLI